MRGILAFLMPSLEPMSISVYEDNKGAIDLAKNPLRSSNSKLIDIRYHFLRKLAASGDISVQYLRTEDQHADIQTKSVGKQSFERHRDFLLCKSWDSIFSWSCWWIPLLEVGINGRRFDLRFPDTHRVNA